MHMFLVASYVLTGLSYALHAGALWNEVRGRKPSKNEALLLASLCSSGVCSQLMALSYLTL